MTEATVEKIARLMHEEACDWIERHGCEVPEIGKREKFEEQPVARQDRYRAVARKVLKALGR